jgi:hypothetical protein
MLRHGLGARSGEGNQARTRTKQLMRPTEPVRSLRPPQLPPREPIVRQVQEFQRLTSVVVERQTLLTQRIQMPGELAPGSNKLHQLRQQREDADGNRPG